MRGKAAPHSHIPCASSTIITFGGTFLLPALPVKSCFDDEAREVRRACQRLRFQVKRAKRRNELSFDLQAQCALARNVYRRVRREKMMQFNKRWERFWEEMRCACLRLAGFDAFCGQEKQ